MCLRLEYGKSGIYNSNRLPAEKKKKKKKKKEKKEITRDRSVPDGSDNNQCFKFSMFKNKFLYSSPLRPEQYYGLPWALKVV